MRIKNNGREKSSLELYLKEIDKYPLLNEEEEKNYAIRKDNGDEFARKKLIESNLRFVVNVAKRYQGRGMSLDELISEGNIGLMKAVEKYDHTRGYHLISYAVWWIRQKILKTLCEQDLIRLPMNKKIEVYKIGKRFDNLEGISSERIHKIAKEFDIDELSITELLNVSKEMISLDVPVYDENNTLLIKDKLEDTNYKSPEEVSINNNLKDDINKIFEDLSDKEVEILEYRFGLNGKPQSNLREIGERFKLSKERIRQIEKKGLTRLKNNPLIIEKLVCYLKE